MPKYMILYSEKPEWIKLDDMSIERNARCLQIGFKMCKVLQCSVH